MLSPVANRSSFSSGSFSFLCIGATVFVAPRELRKITISKTTTAVSNDRMIARIMFTLMNSIDLLLYMQSTIPFLVHVERLECRKLISIVQECWCLVDLIIARYLESLGRCTSGQSVFHAFISDRMTPKFSLLCFVFFEQAPTIMFYHIAWITIGTKTSLTSRERTLLSILLRGHVFCFFFNSIG